MPLAFPSTVVLDDFNRTDTSPMTGWNTPLSGALQASGATCDGTSAGFNLAIYSTAYSGNQEAYATVTTKGATGAVIAIGAMMKDDTSLATLDGYQLAWTVVSGAANDTWSLERLTNGAATVLVSGTSELNNADVIGIRVSDGIVTGYRNGTVLGSGADSTYTGSGTLMLAFSDTAFRVDDFGGGIYIQGHNLSLLGVGG
jgi:hypothetical protein